MSNLPGAIRSGKRAYQQISHESCKSGGEITYSIQKRAKDVKRALQHHPTKSHLLIQLMEPVDRQTMEDRHDAGQAESDEHQRPIRAPCWCAEMVEPGYG